MPTTRAQGDREMSSGSTDGAHSRNTVPRGRLLDNLEQRVRRGLGEPVGVLDDRRSASGRYRDSAQGQLHDVADGHRRLRPSGTTWTSVATITQSHRRALAAADIGRVAGLALQGQRRGGAATDRPDPGGPVNNQACVIGARDAASNASVAPSAPGSGWSVGEHRHRTAAASSAGPRHPVPHKSGGARRSTSAARCPISRSKTFVTVVHCNLPGQTPLNDRRVCNFCKHPANVVTW